VVYYAGDGNSGGKTIAVNLPNAVEKVQNEMALIHPDLKSDLDRLSKRGIPVDVLFEQGVDVLGLK